MKVVYDPECDAAYIHLTDDSQLEPGRQTIQVQTPGADSIWPMVLIDWKDGRLTGIEVLDARHHLPADLLIQAEVTWPSGGEGGQADGGLVDTENPVLAGKEEGCELVIPPKVNVASVRPAMTGMTLADGSVKQILRVPLREVFETFEDPEG